MKISSDASALRLTHEGVANFHPCMTSIRRASRTCIASARTASLLLNPMTLTASQTKLPSLELTSPRCWSKPIRAVNTAKHYGSISRVASLQNMGHASVLETFKNEHEAYLSVKDDDDSKIPKINDRDKDRKIIR